MKVIKRFRKEEYGWCLDLDDAEASLVVDTTSGDLLLNEGAGEDCFHGAAISRSAFFQFALEELPDSSYQLVLKYGLTGSHVLGVTNQKAEAEGWIEKATSAILSPTKLQQVLKRHPPFSPPPGCGPATCLRVCNSETSKAKFVLEPWSERYCMHPNAAFDAIHYAPPGERPEITSGNGVITLNAGAKSLVRLFMARLGAYPAATPSEIVNEEIIRARKFGEFELSEQGAHELKKHLRDANRAFDSPSGLESEDRNTAILWCSTISSTLALHSEGEYRLRRETVWRVSARLLQLVSLSLELFESAADKLFDAATNDEVETLEYLQNGSWDGTSPLLSDRIPETHLDQSIVR